MAARKRASKKSGLSLALSIYLLKPTVTAWQEALHKPVRGRRRVRVRDDEIQGVGTMVVKETKESTPWWVTLFEAFTDIVSNVRQKSPGAILFVEAAGRLFAVTFGYGRSLLAPENLVHDFGIRVVLNRADPSALRNIDTRSLEFDPVLIRKQFARGRPLSSFDVNTYRDVLRGVVGKPRDDEPLMAGTDGLHSRFHVSKDLRSLPTLCARLLADSEATTYLENFAFIDHVRLVKDEARITELDTALHAECRGAMHDIGFAVPDLVEPEQLDRMRGSWLREGGLLTDDMVKARLRDRAQKAATDAFTRAIKSDRVQERTSEDDGVVRRHWPLRRCIQWMTTRGGSSYIFMGGDWFAVDDNFIDKVIRDFDSIHDSAGAVRLPAAVDLPVGDKSYYEAEYNIAAAKKDKSLRNLDRKNVIKGKGKGINIEGCDLLDAVHGELFHIKDGRKSAVLSHLAHQGVASLDSIVNLPDVRAEMLRLAGLPQTGKTPLHSPFSASRLSVIFGIIDRPPDNDAIPWRPPFLAMLALNNAAERIRRLQATAKVVRIDDQRSGSRGGPSAPKKRQVDQVPGVVRDARNRFHGGYSKKNPDLGKGGNLRA